MHMRSQISKTRQAQTTRLFVSTISFASSSTFIHTFEDIVRLINYRIRVWKRTKWYLKACHSRQKEKIEDLKFQKPCFRVSIFSYCREGGTGRMRIRRILDGLEAWDNRVDFTVRFIMISPFLFPRKLERWLFSWTLSGSCSRFSTEGSPSYASMASWTSLIWYITSKAWISSIAWVAVNVNYVSVASEKGNTKKWYPRWSVTTGRLRKYCCGLIRSPSTYVFQHGKGRNSLGPGFLLGWLALSYQLDEVLSLVYRFLCSLGWLALREHSILWKLAPSVSLRFGDLDFLDVLQYIRLDLLLHWTPHKIYLAPFSIELERWACIHAPLCTTLFGTEARWWRDIYVTYCEVHSLGNKGDDELAWMRECPSK